MCVHKKYHGKRLSVTLIKELVRRVSTLGKLDFGHFVSEKFVAKPVSTINLYRSNINETQQILKKPIIFGEVRDFKEQDTIPVLQLMRENFKQYQIKISFSKNMVKKTFIDKSYFNLDND
tara:strand:- start:100 stop:459 length:360 start_codon:yes stop_codon:yes gene_type:complete